MEESFGREVEQGLLALKEVKGPRARELMGEFGLTAKGFVLVEYQRGAVKRFRVLKGIWKRFRSQEAVRSYVRREIEAFLRR